MGEGIVILLNSILFTAKLHKHYLFILVCFLLISCKFPFIKKKLKVTVKKKREEKEK